MEKSWGYEIFVCGRQVSTAVPEKSRASEMTYCLFVGMVWLIYLTFNTIYESIYAYCFRDLVSSGV
jgi:hypothetical protein